MIRRWLIRSFFSGLLVVCVGWLIVGLSYDERDLIRYKGSTYCLFLGTELGELRCGIETSPLLGPAGFSWQRGRAYMVSKPFVMETNLPEWLDFSVTNIANPSGSARIIKFPFWFPTLLSTLLLWLVWRKTRPTYNGRGFPVEVVKKAEG